MSAKVVRAVVVEAHPVAAEQLRRDLWGHPVLSVVAVVRSADGVSDADVALVAADLPGAVATLAVRLPVVAMTTDGPTGAIALDAGAVDLWARGGDGGGDVADLAWRAVAAAAADVRRLGRGCPTPLPAGYADGCVLAIAAGAGSAGSLATVLAGLPPDAAAVVATPLPPGVAQAWLDRVDTQASARPAVARDGDRVVPGRVLVAAADRHLLLRPAADGGWAVAVLAGPRVNHHRPSLDVLLNSVAATAGPRAVVAVLGGVGPDGLAGLTAVRRAGGRTVVESPDTAVCPGLTAAALRSGAAEVAAPAERLAAALLDLAGGRWSNRAA